MYHFKVFLLESNVKQEAYMKHTLTSEMIGAFENFVPQKNFQNLIFRPGIS